MINGMQGPKKTFSFKTIFVASLGLGATGKISL